MDQANNSETRSQTTGEALSEIAQGGSDWEVYHDPATGQMKFVRRTDTTAPPPPGSVPVTTIAKSGFATE